MNDTISEEDFLNDITKIELEKRLAKTEYFPKGEDGQYGRVDEKDFGVG